MKKILIVISLMVCIMLTASNVLAATEVQPTDEETIDIVKDYIAVDYEGEDISFKEVYEESAAEWISQIEKACVISYGVEERDTLKYRHLEFMYENAFRQYILKNDWVINAYIQNGNFKDNISENYEINIPIKNRDDSIVVVSEFSKYSGEWGLGSFGTTEISHPILFDTKQLSELIITSLQEVTGSTLDETVDSVKTIRVFEMYEYYTITVYIETTDGEYLIPLTTLKLFTDLELNKLYTAEEFVEVLKIKTREELPTQEASTNPSVQNTSDTDGETDGKRPIDIKTIALIGNCIGVLGIAAVVLCMKKNKKNSILH